MKLYGYVRTRPKQRNVGNSTPCNYCSWERMRETAKQRNVGLLVQFETEGEMKGWYSARYSDKEEPSAWFKELTDKCVC
jgi:hypothetical protein